MERAERETRTIKNVERDGEKVSETAGRNRRRCRDMRRRIDERSKKVVSIGGFQGDRGSSGITRRRVANAGPTLRRPTGDARVTYDEGGRAGRAHRRWEKLGGRCRERYDYLHRNAFKSGMAEQAASPRNSQDLPYKWMAAASVLRAVDKRPRCESR